MLHHLERIYLKEEDGGCCCDFELHRWLFGKLSHSIFDPKKFKEQLRKDSPEQVGLDFLITIYWRYSCYLLAKCWEIEQLANYVEKNSTFLQEEKIQIIILGLKEVNCSQQTLEATSRTIQTRGVQKDEFNPQKAIEILKGFFTQYSIKNIGVPFNQIETNVTENDIQSVRSSNHPQNEVLDTITSKDLVSEDRFDHLKADFGQEEQIYRTAVSFNYRTFFWRLSDLFRKKGMPTSSTTSLTNTT